MDVSPPSSLERILSRRTLIRGQSRFAAIWSVVAMVSLIFLLLDFNLLMGLLINQGRVDSVLTPPEVTQFEKLTELKVAGAAHATNENGDPTSESRDPLDSIHVFYDEHGILPVAWQTRDSWWGGAVSILYRKVSWLQTNILALIWILSVAVLLFVFRCFCLGRIRYHSHRASLDGITAVRRQLHRQIIRISPEDLDGTGNEMANQLFVNDVEILRNGLFQWISTISRYPLELLGLLFVLLSLNWQLSLQWIAALVLGILLMNGVRRSALLKSRLAEDRGREEQQILLSSFKNARLTRGLGIERDEHEQFQKHLNRYHSLLNEYLFASDAVDHPSPYVVFACAGLVAFLVFLVCSNVLASKVGSSVNRLTVADGLTFFAAVALSIPSIFALKLLPVFRHDLSLSAEKIQRYLNRVPTVSQAIGAKFLQPMGKTLHFENVKYVSQSGQKILDGVDFKFEVDKCYAIVSADPLEAKAVALMLPRFIEPREGRVMIDGEDIAWVTLESLRAEAVFVAADDPPFEGTVFENIRGGQTDLTLHQVTEAAKISHAHNFIVKLFNGYETVLTGEGDSLDIGQRFRLGLARAIVRNPALLIIEEPWSPLDDDTKALLADAYDRICRERTVIFLPARMSTVRRTDQVLVLHEGKVAALGPHAKLVDQSSIYRHWEYMHFNEFRREAPVPVS